VWQVTYGLPRDHGSHIPTGVGKSKLVGQVSSVQRSWCAVIRRRHCYRYEGLRTSPFVLLRFGGGQGSNVMFGFCARVQPWATARRISNQTPSIPLSPVEGSVAARRQCGSVNAQSHRVLPGKGHESGTWQCFCFCLEFFRFCFHFGDRPSKRRRFSKTWNWWNFTNILTKFRKISRQNGISKTLCSKKVGSHVYRPNFCRRKKLDPSSHPKLVANESIFL